MKIYRVAIMLAIGITAGAVAGEPTFKAGEETTMEWKGLPSPIKVYLPTDYSAEKKYPCIFFYPGTGWDPDTRFMREFTEGKTYVIVGMEYHVRGYVSLPNAEMEKYYEMNLATYRSVRAWLEKRLAIDSERVYMGGISKGGWLASLQGEKEIKRLAGLIILKAGRHWTQASPKDKEAFKGKPIFIGVGELDPNDLSAHGARSTYANLGANVLLEEFPGVGHEAPAASVLLADWLAMQGPLKDATAAEKTEIDAWARKQAAEIENITDLRKRYYALDLLRVNPKMKFVSSETLKALQALWIATTGKGTPGHEECAAEKEFRLLASKEHGWWAAQNKRPITKTEYKRNFHDVKTINDSYVKMVSKFPNTRCLKRAQMAIERLSKPIASMAETMKDIDSAKPTGPSNGAAVGVGKER